MKFKVSRNKKYDFAGESYAPSFPNLHQYPATMIPQIGIELFFNGINLNIEIPAVYNIDFWFPKNCIKYLANIKSLIDKIENKNIRNFFLIPFSETVRECSYARNSEFKLFRMEEEKRKKFNPDVTRIFSNKLNKVILIYEKYYYPILDGAEINLSANGFSKKENFYDVVLTSPPYGDSRTTVAYGQFSILTNEWLGVTNARQIDKMLMGGKKIKEIYKQGLIRYYINEVAKVSENRAIEVSSFYLDLENSIKDVAVSVKKGGKIIYVVGNRMVKDVVLPTDQFIAEKFEENGFRHLITYERSLSNKAMPSLNSPSNQSGIKRSTMTKEYIIVCEKPFGPESWVVCDYNPKKKTK